MLSASFVCDEKEFNLLKGQWNDLLEKSNSDSVFLSWEWLYTWWRHFGQNYSLKIIVVRDKHDCLVGIAPFCITNRRGEHPKRTLVFMGAINLSSEYLDIISLPGQEKGVVQSVFAMLCDHSDDWDHIVLSDILDSSVVYKYMGDMAGSGNFSVKTDLLYGCPYLLLKDSEDQMLGAFDSKLKSTIRRRSKKLEKAGAEFKTTSTSTELPERLDALFDLHQKCWNDRDESGNFNDQTIRSFHADVSRLLLDRGLLCLYTLDADEHPIAALYGFRYKSKMFYFQSGYDPLWRAYSPGTVLMWNAVKDSINAGLREFDYLRGKEYYKSLWSDHCRNTYSMRMVPGNKLMIRLFYAQKDLKQLIKSSIKKLVRLDP